MQLRLQSWARNVVQSLKPLGWNVTLLEIWESSTFVWPEYGQYQQKLLQQKLHDLPGKYVTDFGPNDIFDGFKVRPAACNAANRFSKELISAACLTTDKNAPHLE